MENSGFFKSDAGDRKYKDDIIATLLNKIASNGVFNNELQVIPNDNMSVTLKPGFGFINGRFYYNDSEKVINITLADNEQSRIDSIVLRYTKEERRIIADVLEGSYSTNPIKPELTRNSNIYELRLCNIKIEKSIDKITTEMIEDCRFNANECGNVIFPIEHIDTSNIFSQYEAKFNNWFNDLKIQLTGDVAGNLLNLINNQADLFYPVGRGFIDFTGQDFSNYLGFTWERTLLGVTPIGFDENDEEYNAIGNKGGSKTYKLNENNIPPHSHGIKLNAPTPAQSGAGVWPMVRSDDVHVVAEKNETENEPFSIVQPYEVVAFWKRVK